MFIISAFKIVPLHTSERERWQKKEDACDIGPYLVDSKPQEKIWKAENSNTMIRRQGGLNRAEGGLGIRWVRYWYDRELKNRSSEPRYAKRREDQCKRWVV